MSDEETLLTREQALRLAEVRAAKGMPLSAHVVSHLLEIIREAMGVLREYQEQGRMAGGRDDQAR